ncbi:MULTISPECIES: rhodanese family protein [unclassified Brenneria]|uniref:rhodanese family protein n=1 Tax=unclassified Brenneria TaxID=2634434 RepID=UPI0029C19850|nr:MULTISPECIES: rhodanese family protein [unclassified Brenneria]MDX5627747.1 rhodanese family protein [Brenneria sp. L3-3Z]MDX5695162.1 rhodanese family protein [Brenneria sp. L4-2C]MEE3660374.1 rhodanese family protein [Brenneria sp. g21c3]
MSIKIIQPQHAQQLLENGAQLIDIRAADEYAREHIAQAQNIPLTALSSAPPLADAGKGVIFHCQSGRRTELNIDKLAASVQGEAYILERGLSGWKQAGFSTIVDASQPLELNRQVQIAVGSIALLGAILGATVSPWFHILSGFVGAGLIFAGISGFCGMAHLLMKMPWNRR